MKLANRRAHSAWLTGFYVIVSIVALIGGATAATKWLGVGILPALVAVSVIEYGGIVLAIHADQRRLIGERATLARFLSVLAAFGAVFANVAGHPHIGQAAFYGGMSAFGYAIYLLDSGARRRDSMRERGLLDNLTPSYGIGNWVSRPALILRARTIAINTGASKSESIRVAEQNIRDENRDKAISSILRREILRSVPDKNLAEVAVLTLPLTRVANSLSENADVDGFTRLIGSRLAPIFNPDNETDDVIDVTPISPTSPIEWESLPKNTAVMYAAAATGSHSATTIADYLAVRNVTTDLSYVRRILRSIRDMNAVTNDPYATGEYDEIEWDGPVATQPIPPIDVRPVSPAPIIRDTVPVAPVTPVAPPKPPTYRKPGTDNLSDAITRALGGNRPVILPPVSAAEFVSAPSPDPTPTPNPTDDASDDAESDLERENRETKEALEAANTTFNRIRYIADMYATTNPTTILDRLRFYGFKVRTSDITRALKTR